MQRHSHAFPMCPFALGLATVGCVSPHPSSLDYSVQQLEVNRHEALGTAARAALVDEGYEIDTADPVAGIVMTRPLELSARVERAPSGRSVSSRSSSRRLAQVRWRPDGRAIYVYCKVLVQQQTTEAYRLFHQEQSLSDLPGETAIDREAATTREQNTVWRTVRRDRAAERRILHAILQSVSQ